MLDKNEIDEIYTEDHKPQLSVPMKFFKVIVKMVVAVMMYACWANILTRFFNLFLLFSFAGFAWVAYKELRLNNFITMIFALVGTILLNPVLPLNLNLGMQSVVYLILAIGLIGSAVFDLFKAPPNYEDTKFGS